MSVLEGIRKSCAGRLQAIRDRKRREAARRVLARFPLPLRLHLGCGKVRFEGWVNMDADDVPGTVDLVWDLRDGIPAADATCEYIYSEHVLEHFPVDAGVSLLRECRRALRPDGVLRVAMPSLDAVLEKVCRGDWRDQDWLRWPEYGFVKTRAEMLNILFRWWGHEWLYDDEELIRRLREAGFEEIRRLPHGSSDASELRGRETRADSLLVCEARR